MGYCMRKTILATFILLTVLPFLGSCAGASAGITTSSIPVEGRKYTILGTAETTIRWISIDIGIIALPLSRPPIDEAERALISEKGGDALINLRYFTDRTIILPVTIHRFYLKAEVIKFE